MTAQEIQQITRAFSDAWGVLFNAPTYISRFAGAVDPTTINQVYKEVKNKKHELFGPLNASVTYQPTLQLLNENGLLQAANAMITFVNMDLNNVVGNLGTLGYNSVNTQDNIVVPWVDGTQKTMRLSEYSYNVQFGGTWVFLMVGVVEVLK